MRAGVYTPAVPTCEFIGYYRSYMELLLQKYFVGNGGGVPPTYNLIYKFEICYKFEMCALMNSGSINIRKTYMTSSFPSREKCVIYGSETVLRQSHVIKLAINFNQLHLKSAITDQSFDVIGLT